MAVAKFVDNVSKGSKSGLVVSSHWEGEDGESVTYPLTHVPVNAPTTAALLSPACHAAVSW